ncbi:hypothetical protein BCR42DRAFT_423547 [Absidia repens]|uniref:Uncharacterized protein n=1 Tax=Absidia repens TaxID=90262 RepID=A0A1X2I501_9FUNG|nr:hypothetical protein BCR42DRAFT_423547 [Absidia repens]
MASNLSEQSFTQQIDALKQLQEQTQQLLNCKSTLLQTTELLENKTNILDELKAERHARLKEKRLLLDMIQGVQRDIESITEMEDALGRECADLQKNVQRIRNEEYEPLQESVNTLRIGKGLIKIAHVQQEMEAQMAQKLKERRENWQQGASSPSSSSSPLGSIDQVSTTATTTSTTSRRRATNAPSSNSNRSKKRRQ